jgi:putative serine protease PepD
VASLPPLQPRPPANGLPRIDPRPEQTEGLPPLAARKVADVDLPSLAPPSASPPAPEPARRGGGRRGTIAAIAAAGVLALVGAGLAGALLGHAVWDDGGSGSATATGTPTSTPAPVPASAGLMTLQDAVAAVEPSVVQVIAGNGRGSGVITDDRGLIITNQHVVGANTEVIVLTADHRRVGAEVVRVDPGQDLAVLRPIVPAGRGVTLADEPDGNLRIGDTVFAIGSPFNLQNTVTSGVVSAIRRRGRLGLPLIQTDAPINPGNSGGGLFDLRGRLVGVNTSIESPIRGNVGIGFAVPASRVRAFLSQVP